MGTGKDIFGRKGRKEGKELRKFLGKYDANGDPRTGKPDFPPFNFFRNP